MTDRGELLAVDPSIRSSGVAIFRDGSLAASTVVRVKASDSNIGARSLVMAHAIVEWVAREKARPRIVALEWPQIYRGAKSKGDPNDLPGLAGVAMAVAGVLSISLAARHEALEVLAYTPHEWAGNLPKNKTVEGARMSPRAKRIMSRLDDDELRLEAWTATNSHDAIDAIGIGLYALGRLEPIRVFPGATDEPIH